jgi:hypothetical protein
MQNDQTVPTPGLAEIDPRSETPLADKVLGKIDNSLGDRQDGDTELGQRLAALKHEVERLKESVVLLSSGARDIVVETPSLARKELRNRVRARPLPYMLYAAGTAFLFGRYLSR